MQNSTTNSVDDFFLKNLIWCFFSLKKFRIFKIKYVKGKIPNENPVQNFYIKLSKELHILCICALTN